MQINPLGTTQGSYVNKTWKVLNMCLPYNVPFLQTQRLLQSFETHTCQKAVYLTASLRWYTRKTVPWACQIWGSWPYKCLPRCGEKWPSASLTRVLSLVTLWFPWGNVRIPWRCFHQWSTSTLIGSTHTGPPLFPLTPVGMQMPYLKG